MAAAVLLTGPVAAQQTPPMPALPAAYADSDIAQALATRDWRQAGVLLAAAVERSPNGADTAGLLRVAGRVFLIDRKPLNAAIALKKAEALAPLDEGARFTLALAYLAMSRGDWARPEFERLAAAAPANSTYEYWLGRLDYDAGRYAAAAARFERVIARDPGFVRAHDNLGLAREALNETGRAVEHYRLAVALNRNARSPSPWPAVNLATALRHQGELDEAASLLEEALRYDAAMPQALYQLGVVREQQDRLDEAVSCLERAARADRALPDPHYALARIHRRAGRAVEAAASLATFERLRAAKRGGDDR